MVYNVGYLGNGKYKTHIDKKKTKCYIVWHSMLQRCYDTDFHKTNPAYIGCSVCNEWHCFQNFAKWYYENYYEIEGQQMQLDKDILVKGNKMYSPDTCMFVPKRINALLVSCTSKRGEYPVGVSYDSEKNKLRARCSTLEGRIHLGYFSLNEPFKAFTTYKNFKENYIKKVADEYKKLIPAELYKAMYEYEVSIND